MLTSSCLSSITPLCEYASQYISDDDSEELVQELMLFLWETRENLVIETSLKSYLFISTKHRCSMRSGKPVPRTYP